MKTIISIVALMFTLGTLCGAEIEKELRINKDGKVFEVEVGSLLKPEQREAYDNPGKKIHLFTKFGLEKEKFFWGYTTKKAYKSLIREGDTIKTINEETIVKEGPNFLLYIPFFMILVLLKVYENRRAFRDFEKFKRSLVSTLIFGSFVALLFFACIFAASRTNIIASGSGLCVLMTLAPKSSDAPVLTKKSYWIRSIIFYVACVVALVV